MKKINKNPFATINASDPRACKDGRCAAVIPISGEIPDIKLNYQEMKDALVLYGTNSFSESVTFAELYNFNLMPNKMLKYYFSLVVKPKYLGKDPDYGTELEKKAFETYCNELRTDTDILFLELPPKLLNLIKHLIRELRSGSENILKQYNLIVAIQHYLFEIKDWSVLKDPMRRGSQNSSIKRRTYSEKTLQKLKEGKPILEIMNDEFNIRYSPNVPEYKTIEKVINEFYNLNDYNPNGRNTTFSQFCEAVESRTDQPISKQKRYQTLSKAQNRLKK